MNEKQAAQIIEQLESLKKLMILSLIEKGFSQSQVALTLGVDQGTVSRMFPKGVLNKTNPKAKG